MNHLVRLYDDDGLRKTLTITKRSVVRGLPVHHVEASLEDLYSSQVVGMIQRGGSGSEGGGGSGGGGRGGGRGGLTKKEIGRITSNALTLEQATRIGDVLRKFIKNTVMEVEKGKVAPC